MGMNKKETSVPYGYDSWVVEKEVHPKDRQEFWSCWVCALPARSPLKRAYIDQSMHLVLMVGTLVTIFGIGGLLL
eukprot:scaffold118804_cov63-Attheya_sp.AAC.1